MKNLPVVIVIDNTFPQIDEKMPQIVDVSDQEPNGGICAGNDLQDKDRNKIAVMELTLHTSRSNSFFPLLFHMNFVVLQNILRLSFDDE